MPLDEKILGFSDRWYKEAMHTAKPYVLGPGLIIRAVSAPHFLATKFSAYEGGDRGDIRTSKDLEDIVSVVDGRPSLIAEVEKEGTELRSYLRAMVSSLLERKDFEDALQGYLLPDAASQARIGYILERLALLGTAPAKR